MQFSFIDNVFGATTPMTASDQKETFQNILVNTLGDECDFETVKTIHETINDMIEQTKDEPEPLMLTRNEVKHIFEESEVPNEKLAVLEKQLESVAEEKPATFMATNIVNTRQFNVSTPDVVIKVNPDRTDLIKTKMVDGRKCLVIEVNDQIEVNGININLSIAEEAE